MRGCLPAALCLLLIGCAAQPTPPSTADRQVLVVFANDPSEPLPHGSKRGYRGHAAWPVSLHTRARAHRVAREHGLQELHAWPIRALALYCVVLEVPVHRDRAAVIERLAADPRVERAQTVNRYRGMIRGAYDDPLFEMQYGEHRHVVESVHAVTTGRGVRVGIVDGEVDTGHPDLRGQIRQRPGPRGAREPAALRHGTAVAGVIAAAAGNGEGLVGLAPDARVSVYAACRPVSDGTTACTTVSLAEAIEQAIDDASDVINLSLAGPPDWLLEQLLAHAHRAGIVLVAAANAADPERRFPGSLPYVHAAGEGGRRWFAQPAQFSTRAGGGYQVFFGSSMAAAGVSGMAALLRSRHSEAETASLLRALLDATCAGTDGGTTTLPIFADDDAEACVSVP